MSSVETALNVVALGMWIATGVTGAAWGGTIWGMSGVTGVATIWFALTAFFFAAAASADVEGEE